MWCYCLGILRRHSCSSYVWCPVYRFLSLASLPECVVYPSLPDVQLHSLGTGYHCPRGLSPFTLLTWPDLRIACGRCNISWLLDTRQVGKSSVLKGTAADVGILPGLWIQSEEPSDKREMFCVRARVIFGTLTLGGPRRPLPPPLPCFRVSPSLDLPTELPASTTPAILTTRPRRSRVKTTRAKESKEDGYLPESQSR